MRRRLVLVMMAAGCGRLGFGDGAPGDGAVISPDASTSVGADDDAAPAVPRWANGVTLPDVPLAPVVLDGFRWMSTTTGQIYEGGLPDIRPPGEGVANGLSFQLVPMAGGGTLAVLAVESFTIPAGAVLRPKGLHALAIIARGDIVIEEDGVLEADGNPAGGFGGGPGGLAGGDADSTAVAFAGAGCGGGGAGLADTTNGAQSSAADGGGAGGSYGTLGAPAADHGDPTEIGAPVACAGPSFEPLVGGGGGGAGGAYLAGPLRLGGRGGGGGGAIHLAAAGRIVINGRLSAAGGGGEDGGIAASMGSNWGGGGGGGAGGAILLEAPQIQIGPNGRVTANGGGGGASSGTDRGGVSHGLVPANGSTGETGATAGGTGCIAGTPAASGPAPGNGGDAGGGGGGCGIIEIASVAGTAPTGLISPAPTARVLTYLP